MLGAALMAGMGFSAPALAEIKWTMSGSSDCGSNCLTAAMTGAARTFTSGGVTVSATAWSNTGGVTGSSTTTYSNGAVTGTSGTLETAYLGLYGGGLGVKNRDGGSSNGNTGDTDEFVAPEHAADNQSRYDSVLFSFSTAVDLNKVEIGWSQGDSDVTVLAYTGANTPSLSGKSYSQLTSNGWTFVGHYTDLVSNAARNVNSSNVSSAFWLVGSYIPQWGDKGISTQNDHVKLIALYGDKTTRVPEPHSLLLLGIAAIGLWATRKTGGGWA